MLDAHCHFWKIDRGDHGWLAGEGGPLAAIRRDFLPEDYPLDTNVIAVQAAPTLAETDWLLDLAAATPWIAGVVGWVDLADPSASQDIRRRADNPAFAGIRPMLQDIEATDWLTSAPRRDALEALVATGLSFDALITPRHLPVLRQFARANPELAVVIDHAAKPRPDDRTGWAEQMKELAAHEQVFCKLSGLLNELSLAERAAPLTPLREIFARLLDWFGPHRLIWGSDWPVLTLAADFHQWLELTDTLLAGLSEGDKAAIMGGNAAQFYGVAP